jgi:hypothetical protein
VIQVCIPCEAQVGLRFSAVDGINWFVCISLSFLHVLTVKALLDICCQT